MAKVYSADAASVFIELMAKWKADLDFAQLGGWHLAREARVEICDEEARKLAQLLSLFYSEASIQLSLVWRETGVYVLRLSIWEEFRDTEEGSRGADAA